MRLLQHVLIGCLFISALGAAGEYCMSHAKPEAYDGWRIGAQTWTFKQFNLFDAIDKARSLGLNGIQAYPGQKVSSEIDAGFGPNLTIEQKQALKDKLADLGMDIYAFGVTEVPTEEAEARKLFEFAKEMGIQTIASEPKAEQFDLIDKLCQEFEIKLAIHNHPKPTPYWDPQIVADMCKGRSQWIGACTDTGHWVRSGLDPVECLKKLEGRIHDVHLKEIADGHDVVWGTRDSRIKNILEELHRQGYQGSFTIEYEYNWDNNVPEIRESIPYFNSVAKTLNPSAWNDLIGPNIGNMEMPGQNWSLEDGELMLNPVKKNSDLWTKSKYENFVLDLEFKLNKNANSGVFIRANSHTWLPWIKVQVEDSYGKNVSRHFAGGIYNIQAPTVNAIKPVGEWNRMTITADGPRVCVVLNNQAVLDIDLDNWTEAHKNPDGSKNKFNIAYKDLPRSGWIGLQDHGDQVWYRNIRIKEL
ncbi:MAG: family 16 glycoside hydrolase [Planctomycetota bacterium]|jgi:sugar phosphate isomerase/epimerase